VAAADVVNEILDFPVPGAEAVAVRHRDSAFRTVMFTDVEASTALVDRLGDEPARDIMRRHEGAARRAVTAHGGTEVKAMGDGFMVSFGSASAALDAATMLQREIAAEFPNGDLQVRIGINAGEPIAERDDLHGTAVIRAARIMDRAAGGEVMASSLVRELVAGRNYRFVSRGMRELKGFDEPVPIFELDCATKARRRPPQQPPSGGRPASAPTPARAIGSTSAPSRSPNSPRRLWMSARAATCSRCNCCPCWRTWSRRCLASGRPMGW